MLTVLRKKRKVINCRKKTELPRHKMETGKNSYKRGSLDDP